MGRAPLGQQERSVRGEHPGSAGRAVRRHDRRAARTDEHLVLNIDLAPTFAGLAGTWLPNVDGLSLVPLLRSRSFGWRTDFLIEHLNLGSVGPPTFCAVRDERHKLVRYGNGERELYDLHADPLGLRNRYDVPKYRPVERELNDRLNVLCDPLPPGMKR